MNILNIYPNCSLGGMTTVYINRAHNTPDSSYDFIFFNDAGGRSRFEDVPNINVRIIDEKLASDLLKYIATFKDYDVVRVCTWAAGLQEVRNIFPFARLEYEIHSARRRILMAELPVVLQAGVDRIICPSEWLKKEITRSLPIDITAKVVALPNLLTDYALMEYSADNFAFEKHSGQLPLLWVGRPHFSVQKNYNDFFQILGMLPEKFFAVMVLSLETEPHNIAQMIGIAAQYGILERLVILMNIDTFEMASLYAKISELKGIYCSTALYESFGYAVHESLHFNIPVVSYQIGPFENVASDDIHLVGLGDIYAFRDKLLELA